MSLWSSLLLVVLAWLHGCCVGSLSAQALPAGTVIISINNHAPNDSPGWANHLGLYDGVGYVIESQAGYGVLRTPVAEYWRRDYSIWVLYPRDRATGQRAAEIARSLVGRPYRKLSSLAPLITPPIIPTLLHGTPDGLNCTGVIRTSYEGATGRPLVGFRIPDDVMRLGNLFTNVVPQ